MNIADKIAFRARLEPEVPAVIAGNSIVTFGMLEGAVQEVAARISAFKLAPGSIVAVSIRAPARHLAVTLALMRMGLCSAPFSNDSTLLLLPTPAMAIADQMFVMPEGRLCVVAGDEWFVPGNTGADWREIGDSDPCRIVMSSGTTGRPKPLVLSAATFEWQMHVAEVQLTANGHWSRGLVMMDLSASWSLILVLVALSRAQTVCFAANATEALRIVSLYECGYLMGSVFHIRTLVEAQRQRFVPLPSLNGITLGGSVITASLLSDIQAMLTRRVVSIYGSSEIGCTTIEIIGAEASFDGATGYAAPGVELQIVDEEGRPVAPNIDGRLRIRSKFTAQPADGTPLAEDGWFVPGDIGHLNENGRLFITGRTTDLINVGGAKIAPERVEQVLAQHPNVADSGVVGIPDTNGGDLIVAAVVARGGLDLEELARFVSERFRAAPVARIVTLDRIPRGATGKIVRPMLLQLLKE